MSVVGKIIGDDATWGDEDIGDPLIETLDDSNVFIGMSTDEVLKKILLDAGLWT